MSFHKMTKRYSDEAMSGALAEVKAQTLSLRAAAKKYGVPTSTLADRKSGRVQEGAKWGGKPLLLISQERELINHAFSRAELGIGFTKSTFLRFAGEYASKHGVSFSNGVASEKWWRGLKERHPDFSLRSPEPTSAGRHVAMTRERMCKYFAALKGVLEEHNLFNNPSKIWNMDETGLSLSHKPAKVMAKRGSKVVHCKMPNSRELITVVACGNADGSVIPPHVIIPGKTTRALQGYDVENAPEGTNLSVSDSGWTKSGIARLWFTDTFLSNIGDERPQILIFDGHDSHGHVEFIELARKEDIILIELPSKTSNWTQPLDRTVFKSLKSNWSKSIQDFMSTTGVVVGHAQFFRMFSKAWVSSMTPNNLKNGFVYTGICPYNPGIIPTVAYTPSELYIDNSPPSTNDITPNIASSTASPISAQPSDTQSTTSPSTDSVCPNSPNAYQQTTSSAALRVEKDPFLPLPPSSSPPPQIENIQKNASGDNDAELYTSSTYTSEHAASLIQYDISVPSGSEVVDLPLSINDDGILSLASPISSPNNNLTDITTDAASPSVSVTECTEDTALMVVESALTEQMKRQFRNAYESGTDLDDSLFQTWKMYKNKTTKTATSISDAFRLPMQIKSPAAKKRKPEQYFVISCDAAFNAKVKAKEEKELKQKLVEERKVIRIRKKEEKEKLKQEKLIKAKK